jgi:type 1 glutamine amidotransferase
MSQEGKAAFLKAIHDGKGFIGTHSATDTFHSPGFDGGHEQNYENNGDNTDPYVQMIGAEFIIHGAQQTSHMIVADPKFPGISSVPADFKPHEEWYALKNFAPNLHVLLIQDTTGMTGPMYQRPPYPATWARLYGTGRVFYTNMGHREDIWENPVFQKVLVGGINWAVRNVEADVTPNIKQVTPNASQTRSAK